MWRSLIDTLYRKPCTGILHSSFSCQGDLDLGHDRVQRSSQRELAGSNLAPLLPDHVDWTPSFRAFITRVALVLLACRRLWFWALSTSPFGILTAHCLGSLAGIVLHCYQYPYPLKNGIWGGGVVLKFDFKIPFLQSCFLNDQYSSSFHVIGKQMKIKYLLSDWSSTCVGMASLQKLPCRHHTCA